MLIGKVSRPLGLLPIDDEEHHVDLEQVRVQAKDNMRRNAQYDKTRCDKDKAKIVKFKIGDHVLLKAQERHQTKLDPK